MNETRSYEQRLRFTLNMFQKNQYKSTGTKAACKNVYEIDTYFINILCAQIPKAQKDTDHVTEFLCF